MTTSLLPSMQEIRQAFVDEVSNLGGDMVDVFEEGQKLFLRATFPQTSSVRPRDAINRGTALRANEHDVMIHPYVFRQECRNGAIMAQVTDTCQIQRLGSDAPKEETDAVLEDVRAIVRVCSDPRAFRNSLHAMRRAVETPGDMNMLISIAAAFSRADFQHDMLRMLLTSFAAGGDQSQFGIMNAVTAVARETPDPETRWRLEELGGGVLASLLPNPTPLDAAVAECC